MPEPVLLWGPRRVPEPAWLLPVPPETRSASTPWPAWPWMLRTSSSHKEGCEREWNVASDRFLGENGVLTGVEVHSVQWETTPEGRPLKPVAVENSMRVIEADLILLAMGFTGADPEGPAADLQLKLTPRNGLIADPERHVYTVGDCTTGASLVVRAMADAKKTVREIIRDLA